MWLNTNFVRDDNMSDELQRERDDFVDKESMIIDQYQKGEITFEEYVVFTLNHFESWNVKMHNEILKIRKELNEIQSSNKHD